MSEIKNTGGPAFPGEYVLHQRGSIGNEVDILAASSGLTLHDWFAGQAMAAMIASPGLLEGSAEKSYSNISAFAYAMADAMLAVRAKGGDA